MAGEVVRVENSGEVIFVGKFDTNVYRIQPGQSAVVPVEASWHWAGRPWAIDDPNGQKARTMELDRLKLLYGAHFDDDPQGQDPRTMEQKWNANTPKLRVTTIDGEDITTVLQDPAGHSINPATQTEHEKTLLTEQIDKMRREVAAMQAALNARERGETMPDEEVPEDDPRAVPVGGPSRARSR